VIETLWHIFWALVYGVSTYVGVRLALRRGPTSTQEEWMSIIGRREALKREREILELEEQLFHFHFTDKRDRV